GLVAEEQGDEPADRRADVRLGRVDLGQGLSDVMHVSSSSRIGGSRAVRRRRLARTIVPAELLQAAPQAAAQRSLPGQVAGAGLAQIRLQGVIVVRGMLLRATDAVAADPVERMDLSLV